VWFSISQPRQHVGPGIGIMVTHIFQEFFRVDAVCFDFSDELNMGAGFSVSRGRTKKSEGEFFFIYRV
jgi:hypothetical protein